MLGEINNTLKPAVYTQEKDWDDDPHRMFIFTNEAVLKKIRWRHFLSDCEQLKQDFSVVENRLSEEVNLAKTWLTENYQDVRDNFDPTVVKFRKKYKIIISADVLDDLSEMEVDDESS